MAKSSPEGEWDSRILIEPDWIRSLLDSLRKHSSATVRPVDSGDSECSAAHASAADTVQLLSEMAENSELTAWMLQQDSISLVRELLAVSSLLPDKVLELVLVFLKNLHQNAPQLLLSRAAFEDQISQALIQLLFLPINPSAAVIVVEFFLHSRALEHLLQTHVLHRLFHFLEATVEYDSEDTDPLRIQVQVLQARTLELLLALYFHPQHSEPEVRDRLRPLWAKSWPLCLLLVAQLIIQANQEPEEETNSTQREEMMEDGLRVLGVCVRSACGSRQGSATQQMAARVQNVLERIQTPRFQPLVQYILSILNQEGTHRIAGDVSE